MNNKMSDKQTLTKNGTYLGKTFTPGQEGTKKDGKTWKLFKTEWAFGSGPRKISVFHPMNAKNTKQVTELEEGTQYNICYNEETKTHEPTGETYPSRTAYFIGEPKDNLPTTTTTAATTNTSTDQNEMNTFVKQYREAMKKSDNTPSKNHFIGTYARSKKKSEGWVSALMGAYDKDFIETPIVKEETIQLDDEEPTNTPSTPSIPSTPSVPEESPQKMAEKKDILAFIKEMDNGAGVEVQGIINKFGDFAENMLDALRKQGDVFEVSNGKVKVLE